MAYEARRAAPRPTLPPWLRTGPDFVTVQVLARPGVGRSHVLRVDERGLVTGLRAVPEKGKANDELAGLIAKLASVPRSAVTIIRGLTAKTKVVRIDTANPTEAASRLTSLALKKLE